jgi:4-amino-4-deoxy-L-arabinose transferase-like glycosyltransferase
VAVRLSTRNVWGGGLLLWLLANGLILWPHAPGPSWAVVSGLLLLGVLLPGGLLAATLLARAQPTPFEFILYAGGLGFVAYAAVILLATVIPGPLWGGQLVVGLNLLVGLAALGYGWVWHGPARRASTPPTVSVAAERKAQLEARPADATGTRAAWFGLATVLLVAALLRLPNLGYSDFQGDEARALLRASEAIQGYPSALLIHKKGPLEILVPTGLYAVQGHITEAQARLPFTLAGLFGIAAVYLLGWRMFGATAGWVAAMLLAVDGYLVGFARIVQYQSFVFLFSALVVLALYRQATAARPRPAHLFAAGFFFVGGFYAHYEALWVVIPGLFLLGYYGRQDWRGLARAAWQPAVLTLALLAIYFIPFLLDARWDQTARDLFGNRIGSDFPYNNLVDFFARSTLYSSTYQILFMVVGALAAQALLLLHIWPRRWAWVAITLTVVGMGLTIGWRVDWLRLAGTDHTWLFFAAIVATMTLPRRIPLGARTAWLWFGVPMVLSLFFVNKPNSHVYGFFTGWALVNGFVWEAAWRRIRQAATARGRLPLARTLAAATALLVTLLFAGYSFLFFTYTQVEVLRTWTEHRPRAYWTPYALPTSGSLFGFPYQNGWKVVGALYADGTLDAPFTSNESHRVGEWYSRGAYFCPPDAEYYMLPTTLQPDEALEDPARLAELAHNGFAEWGVVTVGGDPRLRIFSNQPVAAPLRRFEARDYAARFDTELSSPWFVKLGPALVTTPTVAVDYRLNEQVHLKGYTLAPTPVQPGSRVTLELYWEMAEALDLEDKVFVQIIEPTSLRKIAQRDSEPGCTKYSMDEWRAGELNYDPYHLTIAEDAAPGVYTVLVGMYDAADQDRYAVFDAQGAPLGDAIVLTSLEVIAP